MNTKWYSFRIRIPYSVFVHFSILTSWFHKLVSLGRIPHIRTRGYKIDRVWLSCWAKHIPMALWPMELCRRPISLDSLPAINIWNTNETTLHSDKPSTEINKARLACQKNPSSEEQVGFSSYFYTHVRSSEFPTHLSLFGSQLYPRPHHSCFDSCKESFGFFILFI